MKNKKKKKKKIFIYNIIVINIIAWYLIIALNISRVMTIRFIFSVIILIKIQKFEKKEEDVLCISWLVTTVFFFFSLWAWDLKQ